MEYHDLQKRKREIRPIHVDGPFTKESLAELKAGDSVLLSGVIYTARDAAHKRLTEALERGEELPIPLENSILYYAGPTPAREGQIIGAFGPTTSYRMDPYAPRLLRLGQSAMIGKGPRSRQVKEVLQEQGAVYFAAIGGAGALIGKCVQEVEVVAYEDLGAEAIRRVLVRDMPLIVAIDSRGNDLYERK